MLCAVLSFSAVCLAQGTGAPAHPNKPAQADPIQEKIAALEKRVRELEKAGNGPNGSGVTEASTAALEKRIEELESSLKLANLLISQKRDRTETAQLDPSSRDFSQIDSDSGSFLVAVEDATPYLNGYRIKLKIGNPQYADFSNVSLKARWSRSYDWKKYSESSYDSWQKAIHEKEITLNTTVSAGAWNHVEIDLIPCNVDELGFLEVSLKSPMIRLTH